MKIIKQLVIFVIDYFKYSLLTEVVIFTFASFVIMIAGTATEKAILEKLTFGLDKKITMHATMTQTSILIDGKDLSLQFTLILFFIPIIFGLIFNKVKNFFKINIISSYLKIFLILFWMVSSIILGLKLDNIIVPLVLLLTSVICLKLFVIFNKASVSLKSESIGIKR